MYATNKLVNSELLLASPAPKYNKKEQRKTPACCLGIPPELETSITKLFSEDGQLMSVECKLYAKNSNSQPLPHTYPKTVTHDLNSKTEGKKEKKGNCICKITVSVIKFYF